MTRGTLKQLLRAEFSLESTGEEDDLLNIWVQNGVFDVLIKSRVYTTKLAIAFTGAEFSPATAILTIDADSLFVSDAAGNYLAPARMVDRATIIERRIVGTTNAGYSTLLVAYNEPFFSIWPQASGTRYLGFFGTPKPSLMTTNNDDLASTSFGPIPEEFSDAVQKYCAFEIARYDDKKAPLNPRDYEQLYLDRIKEINRERRRGLPPAMVRVGYPDRPPQSVRNDVYP